MIRATTNGVLKGYRSSLMKSFITLNNAQNTVLSKRNFNSYAEDPAAASQAFQLRRSYMRTSSQINVSESVVRKYESATQALANVVLKVDNRKDTSAWSSVLVSLNDPTGDARAALGKELYQLSESIVQTMNSQYNGTFTFAGADGLNVPFTWEGEGADAKLCYRGIPVDTVLPEVAMDAGNQPIEVDGNGVAAAGGGHYRVAEDACVPEALLANKGSAATDVSQPVTVSTTPGAAAGTVAVTVNGISYDVADTNDDVDSQLSAWASAFNADPAYADWNAAVDSDNHTIQLTAKSIGSGKAAVFTGGTFTDGADRTITVEDYNKAKSDMEKLDYMNGEKNFVDIGLGLKESEDNDLIQSSAFDFALQGISFLGYGTDEDGDPKNIASLIRRMGDLCYHFRDGEWGEDSPGYEELNRLAGKLEKAGNELHIMHVDMDAEASFLKDNHEQLESTAYTLNEQFLGLEDVNLADAITAFSWAQYCYNAALKVGNSILSQSLIDYMS